MKKLLLVLCAIFCSVLIVSAQQSQDQKTDDFKVRYQGEVNVGGAFTTMLYAPPQGKSTIGTIFKTSLSRPYIETLHGILMSEDYFAGVGVGVQYYAGKCREGVLSSSLIKEGESRWNTVIIPIFFASKTYYASKGKVKPFTIVSLGGSVVACSNATFSAKNGNSTVSKLRGGFYCDLGSGVEYKHFTFSLGYQYQGMKCITTTYDDLGSKIESGKSKLHCHSFFVKAGVCF